MNRLDKKNISEEGAGAQIRVKSALPQPNRMVEDILGSTEDMLLKNAERVLGNLYVTKRFYLLRHYPYIDDDEGYYRKYCELLALKLKSGINGDQLKHLLDLETKITTYTSLDDIPGSPELVFAIEKIMGSVKQGAGIFCYNYGPNARERNLVAGNDLIRRFKIPEDNVKLITLGSSTKQKSIGRIDVENIAEFNEFYANYFTNWVSDGVEGNMVLLSNRSMSFSFGVCTEQVRNRQEDIQGIEKAFEDAGFLVADYGQQGKLIHWQSKSLLCITPSNLDEAIRLWNICYPRVMPPGNMVYLQNILNARLMEDGLSIDNSELVNYRLLQNVLFYNFIRHNQLNQLENFFHTQDAVLYESGQRALIGLCKNENKEVAARAEQLLIRLFVSRNEEWSKELFKDATFSSGITLESLLARRKIYQEAKAIQKLSIDRSISRDLTPETNSVLLPGLFEVKSEHKRVKTENGEKDELIATYDSSITIDKIIQDLLSDGNADSFVIPTHVG